jgi:hypothetical protein
VTHELRCRFAAAAIAVCALLLPAASGAEVSKEKEAAIREIVRVTGGASLGAQVSATLMQQLRPSFPHVPEEIWSELIKGLDPDEMVELVIPIYDRHFSLEEVQGLLAFYGTPLGQKLVGEMPAIAAESMAVGGEWGKRKMQEIIDRLASQGFQPLGT